MRKILILLVLVGMPMLVDAQMRKKEDIFPRAGNYERRGWTVAPMATYMLPGFKEVRQRLFIGNDSVYNVNYDPRGRVSVGIEVGRFQAVDASRLISFVDLNIGAKILRGIEDTEAVLDERGAIRSRTVRGQGIFDQHMLTLSFNATNIKYLNKQVFMRNSLGINGEYNILPSYMYSGNSLPIEQNIPGNLLFQAHYIIGFGFHASPQLIIIPSIETPLATLFEYDDLKSTQHIFHSRYRPLLFKCQFLILDKRPDRKCPTKKGSRRNSESLFGMMSGKQPW